MDQLEVKRKLDLAAIGTNALLPNVKLLDINATQTAAFLDSRYLPFYYHFATNMSPKRVIQVGPKLGLPAACFLQKCKTVEDWTVAMEPNQHLMFVSNIKKFYKGGIHYQLLEDLSVHDPFDLAFLTEEYEADKHRKYMRMLWDRIKPGALLVVDYITMNESVKNSFHDFCRVENREPVKFDTRYGVGVITKR